MSFVSIHENFFTLCSFDKEILISQKDRPCVLVLNLKYKGKNRHFAIPIRSNIHPSAPKSSYYALPNRSTTKPRHRHGLHYIKMVPITKNYIIKYRIENDPYMQLLDGIVRNNFGDIVKQAQNYLNSYENGDLQSFATDIDGIILVLGI